jgi:hypothetical protein
MRIERLQRPAELASENEGHLRTRTFAWLLETVVPSGTLLADLGAGACIFARRARDLGYQVTAVDGRVERVPDDLGPNIEFIQADVRSFDLDRFDVVAILGLLYHMTLQDQVDLLGRAAGRAVVVDTQIHDSALYTHDAGDWARSSVETEDGYSGVLFPERENPMASLEPQDSFWHTEESLLRLFDASGFAVVQPVESQYVSKYGARKFYVAS